MTRTTTWGWWKGLFLLVCLGGGAAAGGWFYFKRPAEAPVDFKTAVLARGELTQAVTANGQINPVKNVAVGSQVSGIITDLKVDFNSRVKEGDVIAQIDPATYQQIVTQVDAEVLNAKAGLELAQVNHRRNQELLKSNLISPSEADKTLADLHQAEAVVKMREAALKKAQVDMERTTIYAPISGIVISRAVDVGQTVAASFSAPTLFQIANDLAKMEIAAMVSEADVGGVEDGQKVTFTVDAFPSRQFQGVVRQVRYAPTTNQNVVTYTAVVDVNNADLKLRPGMTANASIITAQRSGVLKIPNAALRFRPPDNAILKAGTNAPDGKTGLPGPGAGSPGAPASAAAPSGGGSASDSGERRRRFESMSPEERAAMRERMRSGEGGPGGSGGGPRAAQTGPAARTVYVPVKMKSAAGTEQRFAKAASVKTGITDGAFTEVLEGLNEGDAVITGANLTAAIPGAPSAPPGGSSPFGRPGGPRGR